MSVRASTALSRHSWLEEHRGASVLDVAQRLGLETNAPARWISPCPGCGRKTRNASTPSERRGAVGLPSEERWHCFPCELGGDAIDLVAVSLGGTRFRDASDTTKREVRAWFEGRYGGQRRTSRAERQPVRASNPSAPLKVPERTYPEGSHVSQLFKVCVPVTHDAEACVYLRARGMDPRDVEDRGLAVVLPENEIGAPWARFSRHSWAAAGYRLIFPLVDHLGVVRSCLARRIGPGEGPKSIAPRGHARGGLMLADALGCEVLRSGGAPKWWSGVPFRVVITEGETDHLVAACEASDANEHAHAVLGIFSGSWTSEVAARIPRGAQVIIATDPDEAGDKYAARIITTFDGRDDVGLSRWRSSP